MLPSVREEQREALRCILFGRNCLSQSVLAASLQDDSSTSSTMVTNSSHTSLVCFDHDRRSHCSFTVHCVRTVDHVGAHATQYRHVRYVRARELHAHASRVRRARGYSSAILINCIPTATFARPFSRACIASAKEEGLAR